VSGMIHAATPFVLLWCAGVITELMYLAITTDRQLFAKLHLVILIHLNTHKLRQDVIMSEVLSL
jgi:hypothetical protein